MVQAMIQISKDANQVLNIVKARYNLKDKSQAIERVVLEFGKNFLEPELQPDFVKKLNSRQNEGTVKVKDFEKHFGI